jgi:hypothetical protein
VAWTNPKTWSAAAILTAAELNTHLRDNLNILKTSINDDGTLTNITLLKANSGTSTAAGQTTVDSVAVGTITAKDTIEVTVELTGTGAADMNRADIINVTDTVAIAQFTNALALAGNVMSNIRIRQDQGGSTTVNGNSMGVYITSTALLNNTVATVTTAWTGSWTIGLRHNGVNSGTLKWSWTVRKIVGQ